MVAIKYYGTGTIDLDIDYFPLVLEQSEAEIQFRRVGIGFL